MANSRKVALVTGASSGIGKACATALLAEGWQVVFTGRRIEALRDAIACAGAAAADRATAVPCNVTGSIAYTATKHAVSGLTRAAALDGRPFGIAVGQIDIGNVASDMTCCSLP